MIANDARTIEVLDKVHRDLRRIEHMLETGREEFERSTGEALKKFQELQERANKELGRLAELTSHQLRELSVTYVIDPGKINSTTIISQGGTMFTLTDVQQVHAKATFKDARGNPAEADLTSIQWSSSDPSKVTATPDTDGSGGCTFAAVGPLTDPANPVQVSVTDGSLTITDTIAVTASAATTVGIEFEAASPEQPPTP